MEEQRVLQALSRATGTCRTLQTAIEIVVYECDEADLPESESTCHICREEIDINTRLILKDCRCKRRDYCFPCLVQWFQVNTACPICREPIGTAWHPTYFTATSEFTKWIIAKTGKIESLRPYKKRIGDWCQGFRFEFRFSPPVYDLKPLTLQEVLDFVDHDYLKKMLHKSLESDFEDRILSELTHSLSVDSTQKFSDSSATPSFFC